MKLPALLGNDRLTDQPTNRPGLREVLILIIDSTEVIGQWIYRDGVCTQGERKTFFLPFLIFLLYFICKSVTYINKTWFKRNGYQMILDLADFF